MILDNNPALRMWRNVVHEYIGVESRLEGTISTVGGGTSEIRRSIIADDLLENR